MMKTGLKIKIDQIDLYGINRPRPRHGTNIPAIKYVIVS